MKSAKTISLLLILMLLITCFFVIAKGGGSGGSQSSSGSTPNDNPNDSSNNSSDGGSNDSSNDRSNDTSILNRNIIDDTQDYQDKNDSERKQSPDAGLESSQRFNGTFESIVPKGFMIRSINVTLKEKTLSENIIYSKKKSLFIEETSRLLDRGFVDYQISNIDANLHEKISKEGLLTSVPFRSKVAVLMASEELVVERNRLLSQIRDYVPVNNFSLDSFNLISFENEGNLSNIIDLLVNK